MNATIYILVLFFLRSDFVSSDKHKPWLDEKKLIRSSSTGIKWVAANNSNFKKNVIIIKNNFRRVKLLRKNENNKASVKKTMKKSSNVANLFRMEKKYTIKSSTIQESKRITMSITGNHDGSKPAEDQINQDRTFVLSPFYINNKKNDENIVLLGVFDGHGEGGEIVSSHALNELPTILSRKLKKSLLTKNNNIGEEDEIIKQALSESFVEIDSSLPATDGGCTASIIFARNNDIYVANAGDSLSFIATYHHTTEIVNVIYKSRKDKPSLIDEKERINSKGGIVRQDRVHYHNGDFTCSLAMSRSIGDVDFKKVGVIVDPIVDVIHLKDHISLPLQNNDDAIKVFAVSVTDGVLDFSSPYEIATKVAQSLYHENGNTHSSAAIIEEFLVSVAKKWDEASENEYRDDISIAFSDISY